LMPGIPDKLSATISTFKILFTTVSMTIFYNVLRVALGTLHKLKIKKN